MKECHRGRDFRAEHQRDCNVACERPREKYEVSLANGRYFHVEGVLVVLDAVAHVRAVQLLAALQSADHCRLQVLHERLRLVLLGEVEVEAAGDELPWRKANALTSMLSAVECRPSRIMRCSSHRSVRLCSV